MSEIYKIIEQARDAIFATSSVADLEQAKARFLGKSGTLTEQLKSLGKLPADQRPQAGAAINEAKRKVEDFVQAQLEQLRARDLDAKLALEAVDVTLPGRRLGPWGLHPILRAQGPAARPLSSLGS